MTDYQVSARRYRPKKFKDVIGQEPVVKTLKNALTFNRLAHAYLFCGSRGTGKTTLARIFAKSLNCEKLSEDFEPCCACRSCVEIASGASIDVMEIDGASHRGIDDIRVITESVGYAPSSGKFKIYLIDEVHMLTKEAFNALLKTLEEPPATVKFFFATTEPHKVPETILSRCQRFNLRRIPLPYIAAKLRFIASDQNIHVEEDALMRIAEFAAGGLRDAESLFDQIVAFSDGKITTDMVHEVLGVMPRKWFFDLDEAFSKSDFSQAFQIAQEVFLQGKDIHHFLEDLVTHYRHILLIKLAKTSLIEEFDASYKAALGASQELYSQEQCMNILGHILDAENSFKTAISEQMTLEALLLRIVREKRRIPIEYIAKRLHELEKELGSAEGPNEQVQIKAEALEKPKLEKKIEPEVKQVKPEPKPVAPPISAANPELLPISEPEVKAEPALATFQPQDARLEILPSLEKKSLGETPKDPPQAPSLSPQDELRKKSRYDTLIQFAAVELDATVQKTDGRRK